MVCELSKTLSGSFKNSEANEFHPGYHPEIVSGTSIPGALALSLICQKELRHKTQSNYRAGQQVSG